MPGPAPDEEAILAFVRNRLAAEKRPQKIPVGARASAASANGKLIRKALEKP